jgi:type IV pilus assembly protein PilA
VTLTEILIVVLLVLAVVAVPIPKITHSQLAADESAALASFREISAAEQAYGSTHPDLGFAPDLTSLASTEEAGRKTVDQGVASGRKDGYIFLYKPGERMNGAIRSYTLSAIPEVVGKTGQRRFYSDESGEVRYSASGPADATSPVIQ